jgi:oligosaccharide reducing-end xylanase
MGRATGTGAFSSGAYRNLLLDYGYSESDIAARLEQTWEQLFGRNDETRIYFPADNEMGYMLDTGNDDVRTEGMSYGMMMAVQLDKREIFDRIWKWSYRYMWMSEGDNAGYFAWSCNPDGTKRATGPAPDGEEYFALALFFASHRWGMDLRRSITARRPESCCANAFIRGRTAAADIRCGTLATS